MKYHTTSRQKQLVADDATKDKSMCKNNAKRITDLGATHVISEVTYGFNAYLMFEKEIEKHETKKQIEGSLEVVVKAIPSFQVEGKAQINLNETENSTMAKLAFTFHGDTQLGKVNPHITGLPGVQCSVFTASPDVSDSFYRKLVKNAKLAIFGDIQVQIWQRCENLVILVL